jgi:hypothetical protein
MLVFSDYEGSFDRLSRLINAYQSLGMDVRKVVMRMHDHKGNLRVMVSEILPNLTEEIRVTWEKQNEYSFEIHYNGKTIYSTDGVSL